MSDGPQKDVSLPQADAKAYRNPWLVDAAFWENELQSPIMGFEGNVQNAADTLVHVAQGMQHITETPNARLAIAYKGNFAPTVQYDPVSSSVVVGAKTLKELAEIDPTAIHDFTREDGQVVFRGFVRDYAYILGVEEARHGVYLQDHPDESEYVDALSMNIAEYDARPIEFDALQVCWDAAGKRNMPKETMDFLSARLMNAMQASMKKK